jgi:hypothetical protein
MNFELTQMQLSVFDHTWKSVPGTLRDAAATPANEMHRLLL